MYSPTLMRFIQADPTGAEYVDGPNLYPLERGNPVNRLDPQGTMSIASKIMGILDWRMGRASACPVIGLPWNWVQWALGADRYTFQDDANEMNDLAELKMREYYKWLVENDFKGQITPDWQVLKSNRQSAKAKVGQFTANSNQLASTGWWLNGAHDVFAGGSLKARCKNNVIYIKDIDFDWEWHDRIDANSFVEGKANWKHNKPVYITEGMWDLIVDKVFSADFGLVVKWKSFKWDADVDGKRISP